MFARTMKWLVVPGVLSLITMGIIGLYSWTFLRSNRYASCRSCTGFTSFLAHRRHVVDWWGHATENALCFPQMFEAAIMETQRRLNVVEAIEGDAQRICADAGEVGPT